MQGSRAFYNTLNMVFPILITFFYLLAVNGISDANKLALRLRRRELWLMRFVLGKVYALAAALVITALIITALIITALVVPALIVPALIVPALVVPALVVPALIVPALII